jgi:hypothetical protein
MKRHSRNWKVGLVIGFCLGLPGIVWAGPYVNVMQPCDCPPTHYSALHVLTPAFYRWAAFCQGPCRYIFAKNVNPDVPPVPWITKYHCPSINPMQFTVENYPGLNGQIPASTYQSAARTQQPQPQEGPPQQLPPPRIEEEKQPEVLPQPKEEPAKK